MNIEQGTSHLKTQPDTAQPDTAQPDTEEAFVDEEADTAKAHNRLEDLRRDARMSRKELARELEISPAVLANIERGQTEPGVTLAWTFARYFGLPLEKVFSEQPLPTLTNILKGSCDCNAHTEGWC